MFSFDFFLLTISFFVAFPVFSSTDDPIVSECSRPFQCGDSVNIRYPFWGNGRPGYCGHRDLELKCQDNSAVIEIYEQSYHVLEINEQNHTLHVAKTDNFWDNHCPPLFENICNIFNCSLPLNQNITLAYGCPLLPDVRSSFQIHCFLPGENYFWVDSMGSVPDFTRCNRTVVLPVLRSRVQNLTGMQSTVEEVLKDGFEVGYNVNATFCNNCEQSGGHCGYQWQTEQPTCFCYNNPSQETCPHRPALTNRGRKLRKVVIGVFSAIGAVILVVILSLVCYRNKKAGKLIFFGETAATRNFEQFIKHHGSYVPRRYSFKEIKKMTKSFKEKLGHGGYGNVFKGVLNDGRLVAVKVLNDIKGSGEEFINEVASISRTSHVNIVSLLGYCFDGSKRALIYEFMPNGSLEKYIYDKDSSVPYSNLGWETLHDISVGIARGLEYLHRGCNTRILHFDIKPHNILLDKDFCPKISDFGLAKLCPRKDSIISMMGTRGTAGYIAPEVFNRNFGGVSHKSDVYSYGMMILEMVAGRKNIDIRVDHTSEIYFPTWIYKHIELNEDLGLHGVDSEAQEDIPRKMILVGLWCIQTNPIDRPTMSRVLEMLEGNLNVLEIPPKP